MSEPRRSTRARAREEAAPAPPETPKETPSKTSSKLLKRKRPSVTAKDATPATAATDPENPLQAPKQNLPIRLAEGQPLPTLPAPQPLDLSTKEYQDIQQSGVLSASLQRSRAVWVSGVNFRLFHAFFTPPKKVADRSEEDKQSIQRQKEIVRNFPLVGEAQLVIEPHTFPIRLYGPREMARQVQKKPPTYGQWPNHNQQTPYQYNHASPTPYQAPPQPRPAQPKPQPQKAPQPAPSTPQVPAPDPVIHMLAQRAGQDPELKAVMKIVAAGQATKEQLEFFQGHINELTNILQRQKEAAAKAPPQPPPPPPPQPVKAPPPPQPLPPAQPHQHSVAKIYSPAPPQAHTPQMAPAPPQHSSYSNSYSSPHTQQQQYQRPQPAPQYAPAIQPPRSSYRPLVFDFVEGNGDKFYFPSYSFMEWLPNSQGAKFSFLVTKLKPKPQPEAKVSVPSTPAPKAAPTPIVGPTPTVTPNAPTANPSNPTPSQSTTTPGPLQIATSVPPVTPYVPPPRIEDFDERVDMKYVEFHQPVTVLVLSGNTEVLQSLPRSIRPAEIVERYMNEVFDTFRRADETYLAFRLPKEGGADAESDERRVKSGDVTPAISTPVADVIMGGMGAALMKRSAGRPRKSLVA